MPAKSFLSFKDHAIFSIRFSNCILPQSSVTTASITPAFTVNQTNSQTIQKQKPPELKQDNASQHGFY
jgi:hypothetical protein